MGLPSGPMQADSSLEESKTVSEPPKSRPDYTLAVRRGELRFKNHHPDPRTSRYGQRLVEEILGCRMSGWLTPKLECNKKLQAIPCARLRQEAGRDRTPVVENSPGAMPRGARFGRPGYEAKFALLHARILGRVREFWHFSCHLTSPPSPYSRGNFGPFGARAAPVRYRAVRALVGLDMRRNVRYFPPVFSVV